MVTNAVATKIQWNSGGGCNEKFWGTNGGHLGYRRSPNEWNDSVASVGNVMGRTTGVANVMVLLVKGRETCPV